MTNYSLGWLRWQPDQRLTGKAKQRPAKRREGRLLLEELEPRIVPSTYDGSFQAIHITDLRSDATLGSTITGKGIGIADLDTGLNGSNPDLAPNLVAWYDALGTDEGTPSATAFDNDGHGSHTAGIEAASDPNIGVAYQASLIAVRVTTETNPGRTQSDPLADGLNWVLQNHTKYNILVVNMSLGNDSNYNTAQPIFSGEPELINELEQAGVTVVASSGNSYGVYADGNLADELGEASPAVYATLGVANTWGSVGNQNIPAQTQQILGGSSSASYYTLEQAGINNALAATSQRSTLPNQVAAPGSGIYNDNGTLELGVYSTWDGKSGQNFNVISGTSMAAPMVTGAVALMQQAAIAYGGQPLLPAQIRTILQGTATTITDNTNPNDFRVPTSNGYADLNAKTPLPATGQQFKLINVYAAVKEVIREVSAPSTGGGGGGGSTDTDNTTATANVLPSIDGTQAPITLTGSIGTDGSVQVGPNDVDLYKVTFNSPGTFTTYITSAGHDFNVELRVFDQNGNQIGATSGATNSANLGLQGPLNPGTYYIGVSNAGNNQYNITNGSNASNGQSTGTYNLGVQLTNPDPNGIISGAFPFTSIPNVFHGLIGSDPNPNNPANRIQVGPGDVDMFQIVAPDTGNLLVWTNTTTYGNQGVDTYLRVFDSQGNQLAFNDDSSTAGGNPTDSYLAVAVTKGQQVYVAVSSYDNRVYSATSPFNRTANGSGGSYDLYMDFDNGDQNGTIFDAVPFSVGATVNGNIGHDFGGPLIGADGSKDVDFEKYTPSQSGAFDITATSQTSGFTPVLSLWTYSPGNATTPPSATKVADSSSTQSSELVYQVQAGQNYYVAVTGLGNTDFLWYATASGTGGETGNYNLTTSLGSSSTFTTQSNNTLASGNILTITTGQTVSGNIGMDGNLVIGPTDVDMYKFVAPSNETLDVRTDTSAEGSADTYLRFFDVNGNQLAANDNASASTTASEVQVAVQAGQTYYIGVDGAIGTDGTDHHAADYNPLTGAGAAVSISLGNYTLSMTPVVVTTLTVQGTPGNDTFTFTAGTSEHYSLNGVTFPVPAGVTTINFVSNGGNDSATLTGQGGDYAALSPTYTTLTGPGYTVSVINCSSVTVSSSGNAIADFALTAAGADTYKGTPNYSEALGATYNNTVIGFAHAHGFAHGNSHATAILATGGGSAIFGGVPAYSFVEGAQDSFDSFAIGFANVDAYQGSGASVAYLGMSSGSDIFGGVPAYSFVAGTVNNAPYAIYAVGFQQVQGYAGSATAVAYLATSSGSGDLYYGTSSYSEVMGTGGAGYTIYALGFHTVQAYFGGGPNQIAYLQQYSGSDPYINYGGAIESKGTGYDNFAIGFLSVVASILHP